MLGAKLVSVVKTIESVGELNVLGDRIANRGRADALESIAVPFRRSVFMVDVIEASASHFRSATACSTASGGVSRYCGFGAGFSPVIHRPIL